MAKYYLRIITDSCAQTVENALNRFLHSLPTILELHAEPLKPYWKSPGQGELLCQFSSTESPEIIQAVLADKWEGDVADIRWSHIHSPHTVFIWISTLHAQHSTLHS